MSAGSPELPVVLQSQWQISANRAERRSQSARAKGSGSKPGEKRDPRSPSPRPGRRSRFQLPPQTGRGLGGQTWGQDGREFESPRPDHASGSRGYAFPRAPAASKAEEVRLGSVVAGSRGGSRAGAPSPGVHAHRKLRVAFDEVRSHPNGPTPLLIRLPAISASCVAVRHMCARGVCQRMISLTMFGMNPRVASASRTSRNSMAT